MSDTLKTAYAALLLRVSLGLMFFAHGFILKVLTFTPAGTAKFFGSIGFPEFFAYLVILGEIFGGLALIAGIYSRYIALLLVPIMLGATWVHLPNGWLFNVPNGGWEYPAFWTVTLFVQALLGDGAYALTDKVNRLFRPAALGAAA